MILSLFTGRGNRFFTLGQITISKICSILDLNISLKKTNKSISIRKSEKDKKIL